MEVRSVPPVVIGGLVVLGALGFLTWHSFARDPEDDAWLDPGQPPAQVAQMLVPAHGCGAPMACSPAFRSRAYPDVMVAAAAMVKGEL